ncbi:TonB-dependent receptor domain-containing protein [Flexithrix dorotheae]|uniref:TonB-dependent receptor domain-containing protein n=1 Tax=Flexithrix dorotheae TaxID=70993 RepID=UPI000364F546|nr:outer membrane beta-barrel family protein [Flexithrix dorotheae]
MKRKILIILFTFYSFTGFAQERATVSGVVTEEETTGSLPFSTVILTLEATGETLSGTLADAEGRFLFSGVEPGQYMIICSFVGYQTTKVPVLVGKKNNIYDLGKIALQVQTEELDEVVITAKKEIVSSGLDKKAFSTRDNFAQSGGSVLDAMKALPGVAVDQEGQVLLRGSNQVAILIDGKQSSLTGFGNQKGLDNIPIANIESIEIINNPSAKYDASGMAGIINLIYKKENETGLNGDVGLAFGMGQLNKRKQDLPTSLGSYNFNHKIIPSFNLNYKTSKINAFLQGEVLNQRKLPNNEFTTRYYDDGKTIASQVAENRKQTQYIIKGGVDINIGERDILTLSSVFDFESHVDTSQVPYINLAENLQERYWTWREEEVTGFLNFRADYKHKFEQPGHEINFSLQYTRGWEDETYYLRDSSAIRQSADTTHIIATEHTIPFLIDYVKPLKSGRIEAGTKLQIRRIPVTYTIGQGEQSVIYPGLGEWSDWGENIYAGYFNYVLEKKNYAIEAGLRAEHVDVFYDLDPENIYYDQNDAYDYFRLYPNVRLTYIFNENHNISVFYNNRVDRPGEPNLRVFPKYDDPELMKVGNPYLRPQFTQTFEIAAKKDWSTGYAYFSGYHRIIDDPFTRVYSIDSSDVNYDIVNKIYQNVGRATNTGIELLLSQKIVEIWRINGSFNWYINVIDAFSGTMLFPYQRAFCIEKTENNTWDMKLTNSFSLSENTDFQITTLYIAPKNIPQGKQFSRSSIDLGFKQKIMENKGEITFSFTDIFNQYGIRQELEGDGFKVLYENFYETQVATLGFKYKF